MNFKIKLWAGILLFIHASIALAGAENQRLHQYLAYDPTPLNEVITNKATLSGYSRQHITYDGFDGEKVTAYLAMPNLIKNQKPKTVVLVHGLTQSKDQWWKESGPWSFPGQITKALLDNGFAVFALDARNHGERLQPWDPQNPYAYIKESRVNGFSKMVLNSAIDVRRGIDYLESRNDLDLDGLAVMGFSMGGCIAWASTAADSRIEHLVAMATPNKLVKDADAIPLFSPLNFAPEITKPSVLMVMATEDSFYTQSDANDLFNAVGSDDKKIAFVEGGHDLPQNTVDTVMPWFLKKAR